MSQHTTKRVVRPVRQYVPPVPSARTVKEAMHKCHLVEAKFYQLGADGKPRYTRW